MLFLCYPKCSTCKKAQVFLDENGVAYQLRNIKEKQPSEAELRQWHKMSGLPLKRFFNTSGMLYRSLNLKEKLSGMTEDEQYQLLASDGLLVKRPLCVTDTTVLVGFKAAEWEQLVKSSEEG